MRKKRFLRYLAPNLVTIASLSFGTLSVLASIDGHYARAAWFVVFSVLTDKLDGFVARRVKGTSDFGVQMDSFADFLNFGLAPAALWYAFLSGAPELPFAEGAGHAVLIAVCFVWVLGVTFRLARYNIVGDDPACKRIFFGVPTTLMGGTLVTFFLACLKYGGAEVQARARVTFEEPHLFGGLALGDLVWQTFPLYIGVGALLMASTVRIPKLGLTRSRALSAFVIANVFAGYVFGFARRMPEYLCLIACLYIVGSVVWGQTSAVARSLRAPPIFPPEELPPRPGPVALSTDVEDGEDGDDGAEDDAGDGEDPAPAAAGRS